MGERTSNNILSESIQQIYSQKFMHTPGKGLYKSCIRHCEISNFGFLAFFCVCVLFFYSGRLTWESLKGQIQGHRYSEALYLIKESAS